MYPNIKYCSYVQKKKWFSNNCYVKKIWFTSSPWSNTYSFHEGSKTCKRSMSWSFLASRWRNTPWDTYLCISKLSRSISFPLMIKKQKISINNDIKSMSFCLRVKFAVNLINHHMIKDGHLQLLGKVRARAMLHAENKRRIKVINDKNWGFIRLILSGNGIKSCYKTYIENEMLWDIFVYKNEVR